MKKIKLAHFYLHENYSLNRVSPAEMYEIIDYYNPDIVSIQGIKTSNKTELERLTNRRYRTYGGEIHPWKQTVLTRRSLPTFERTYSLKDDIIQQETSGFVARGNSQTSILAVTPYWLTFIHAKFLPFLNSVEETQLLKLVDLYQNNRSAAYTRYQIIAANGKNFPYEDFCMRTNFTDLSTDIDSDTHILVSDTLSTKNFDICKMKTKSKKERYAVIVDLEMK